MTPSHDVIERASDVVMWPVRPASRAHARVFLTSACSARCFGRFGRRALGNHDCSLTVQVSWHQGSQVHRRRETRIGTDNLGTDTERVSPRDVVVTQC